MSTRQKANILIVDDEPEIRQLLADAFASEALSVRLAGSGAEAIQLARAARPDLVITDLCLVVRPRNKDIRPSLPMRWIEPRTGREAEHEEVCRRTDK